MVNETQPPKKTITLKLRWNDYYTVKKACELLDMPISSFFKSTTYTEARTVLRHMNLKSEVGK